MNNPFSSGGKNAFVYFSVWFTVAFIQFILLHLILGIDYLPSIADSGIFNMLYCLLGISLWYPVKYITFEKTSGWRVLSNHLIAGIVVTTIWVFLSKTLLSILFINHEEYTLFLSASSEVRYIVGISYYALLVSIIYIIIYYNNFKQKLLQESKLQALIKENELRTLKYQINPHFIFNSLNSISALTVTNPEKAREMTIKLSEFLRGTLKRNDKQMNPLSEELNNIRLYLDIEKVRFEGKFGYNENIKEKCSKVPVPSMILQPLIENAIKHGVYESTEKVNINLNCEYKNGFLILAVSNDFDPDSVTRKGEGIGLLNIKERLKLLYGKENLVNIKKEDSVFSVTILIPVEDSNNE